MVRIRVEADAVELVADLVGRAGCDDNVPARLVSEGVADDGAPPLDTPFIAVGDPVDIVENHEVWGRVFEPAEDTTFVIPEHLLELVGRVELIKRVCVEGDVEKSLRFDILLQLVVDELLEERGLADAVAADEAEHRRVLELRRRFVGPYEVIKVAFLPVGQLSLEGFGTSLPPRVVVGERPD
nr:hypothetical protein [Halapricum desulfuricans]